VTFGALGASDLVYTHDDTRGIATTMSDSTSEKTTTTTPATTSGTSGTAISSSDTSSALVTSEGRTTIADTVVSKIAGIAAREVSGVHALGGGAARAVGAIRERIPGSSTNHSQGVSVEVGERQAAVDIQLVAEYGVALTDLATGIRRNVIGSIERMTGLEVTEVNVAIQDIFLDDGTSSSDKETESAEPRVR